MEMHTYGRKGVTVKSLMMRVPRWQIGTQDGKNLETGKPEKES